MRQVGTITRFAITYVEYGDSVDGKARILGFFRTFEDARKKMHEDAKQYKENLLLDDISLYNDSASVGSTDECGCEWRIDEVSIPVYEEEVKEDYDETKNRKEA